MIWAGVHIYVYVCGQKKRLNRTLDIDSPFQIFAVGLLIEIYRLTLPLHAPETLSSSSKSKIFLYNADLALFIRMDVTITRTNA